MVCCAGCGSPTAAVFHPITSVHVFCLAARPVAVMTSLRFALQHAAVMLDFVTFFFKKVPTGGENGSLSVRQRDNGGRQDFLHFPSFIPLVQTAL